MSPGSSARPGVRLVRCAATLALATLFLGLGALGQEIPMPPDHYAALDPFFEGEIVAIREGGCVQPRARGSARRGFVCARPPPRASLAGRNVELSA